MLHYSNKLTSDNKRGCDHPFASRCIDYILFAVVFWDFGEVSFPTTTFASSAADYGRLAIRGHGTLA